MSHATSDSKLVEKGLPCLDEETCGSSNALAVYDDGHAFCFSCEAYFSPDVVDAADEPEEQEPLPDGLLSHHPIDIPKRRISREECARHGYGATQLNGSPVQVADYRRPGDGELVAQKVRGVGKTFFVLGDGKNLPFWQQHRWHGGKRLVVTEGEIDCLVYQTMTGGKWPAVSVPSGAANAHKTFKQEMEWLSGFKEVVLFFDNDEAGREGAEKCAEVLPPGVARIAQVPDGYKDICEAVQAGKREEVQRAFWNAKPWMPEGLIQGEDLWQVMTSPNYKFATEYPWQRLQELTGGKREREMVILTSGTGCGKTDTAKQMAAHDLQSGHRVGWIGLEEGPEETLRGILGKMLGRRLECEVDPPPAWDEVRPLYEEKVEDSLIVYNNFGREAVNETRLMAKIRYMRKAFGVHYIYLDHLNLLMQAWEYTGRRGYELEEHVVTTLRHVVEETGVGLMVICHLRKRKNDQKSFEDGAMPCLDDLKGTGGVKQLANVILAMSRDLQGDGAERHIRKMSVLKDRWRGRTGFAGELKYDESTGLSHDCVSAMAQQEAGGLMAPAVKAEGL